MNKISVYTRRLREFEEFPSDEKFLEKITFKVHYKKHVDVCTNCKGIGYTTSEQCTDYHRGDYDTIYEDCKWCQGSGLILIETKKALPVNGLDDYERRSPFKGDRSEVKKINRGY